MSSELDERLSALLDGELGPVEAETLRVEIARSPELAARLAALAAVDDGLRALPIRRVPDALRARVAQRIAGRPDSPRAPAFRAAASAIRARRWLAAAALAAAAAAIASFVLMRVPREETKLARAEPAPAAESLAADELADADLPVIEVLDVLAELDELEPVGSG